MSYSAWFILSMKRKISITLMLKRAPDLLKDWNIIWNDKIQLDAILQYWVILACLGYFWFILPRSCLFQLVAVGYRLFHISLKKWRLIRHVKIWKHLKVKVRKAHKNWGPIRHVKKEGTWKAKTRRHTGM